MYVITPTALKNQKWKKEEKTNPNIHFVVIRLSEENFRSCIIRSTTTCPKTMRSCAKKSR